MTIAENMATTMAMSIELYWLLIGIRVRVKTSTYFTPIEH